MAKGARELVFLPLGGIGEIGMNAYLYGIGAASQRSWLLVDLGITFPTEREPGVDVILPSVRFLEEERGSLAGILLTHGHEDHIGALAGLWRKLRVPVYATPFTAALLRTKLDEAGLLADVPLHEVKLESRFPIGPFDIELVTMAHSIPEPNAVLIRTEHGNVFHSGDWKIDANPMTSAPTDPERLEALGREGVLALVCDSTNAIREGISPSESDVAESLAELIKGAPHRVAVTLFASNVARIRAVSEAAQAANRALVVVGRAMFRIIEAAQETGYLPQDFRFYTETEFHDIPRDSVVALCTGSQGEPRAALSRIAISEHPNVSLTRGDMVIFSSRTIPGNERPVGRVQNALSDQGVEVITDQDTLVHVSGHPRRAELEQLYRWLTPRIAVPMHGEPRHLETHARLAEKLGVRQVVRARDGQIIRLAPGDPGVIDEAPIGRLYRDGRILVDAEADTVRDRRRLSFAGIVAVSVTMTRRGEIEADPEVELVGLPIEDEGGTPLANLAIDAALGALESIPRARRKDPELVRDAVRRSVRAAINQAWGKKPICTVLVTVL